MSNSDKLAPISVAILVTFTMLRGFASVTIAFVGLQFLEEFSKLFSDFIDAMRVFSLGGF